MSTVSTANATSIRRQCRLPGSLPLRYKHQRTWYRAASGWIFGASPPALFPEYFRQSRPAVLGAVPTNHPYNFRESSPSTHSKAPVELSALEAAQLRSILQDRRAALFWDLDNVDFFKPACSAPLQVHRLRTLVTEAGAQLLSCRAYGNTDTVRRLAVLCVSQDTDFASPLRYLSELGIPTLAISPHDPRRRVCNGVIVRQVYGMNAHICVCGGGCRT
ncbi:hypothetical protein VOLCADRAFT_106325 [Volvox carteri f. nagariensis]|uniref:NYN domain-containing protein n=1 Tax=Volvox carteri f. nagariensis TaxID=3068 RepID=D8U6K9_VOLCA|nr:uncharacterized protein VOLCADRAFT_106325 [Volvox carteri f. nagariensis]EFJ44664.1 hypothetical protein VOLCADRAFT_106325 [Volvox carteri f. nagariensis]|eukprot:XP_002954240.1 hypothetical protein VOLCADRAFT_106325 [Volvox carteri f. nagariensis]